MAVSSDRPAEGEPKSGTPSISTPSSLVIECSVGQRYHPSLSERPPSWMKETSPTTHPLSRRDHFRHPSVLCLFVFTSCADNLHPLPPRHRRRISPPS